MTDFFALLQEPRRPWLDANALKQKFLGLSAQMHPDKVQASDDAEKADIARKFAAVNAAFNCLAEPKTRLLHLLELESGAKPPEIQQIPADLADLFVEVAAVCKNADAFLAEKNKAGSPLLQVQWFERAQPWIETLDELKNKLRSLRQGLDEKLKALDAAWCASRSSDRHDLLAQLEELYRLFAYFNRWSSQVQERAVQMML
jgi:DnaJ-domain-containing protein 1